MRTGSAGQNVFRNESSADRKERASLDHVARRAKRREPQSIRMLCRGAWRKHDVAVKQQIVDLIKMNRVRAGQFDPPSCANFSDCYVNCRRIDLRRLVPRQS